MAETYLAQCAKIFRLNPEPTTPQVQQVMKDVGCSKRTAYRALREVREANLVALTQSNAKQKKTTQKNKGKKRRKKKSTKGRKKSITGNIATPKAFQKAQPIQIPRIDPAMSFEHFCKTHAYPFYKGLYRWQYAWYKAIWPKKFSSTKVSRDHGKSIGHGNVCQHAMSANDYDVLYLGWTARRREIAGFVNKFFWYRKELVSDKTSSPFHFKTVYGTKFDTYSVKSKEILGMHEMGELGRDITDENRYLEDYVRDEHRKLLLVIDDPIDNTFKKERHKAEALEDFFLSTIISINPDKLMVVGTHKYDGDFLHFLERKVYKDKLFVYKRTPYLEKTDPRYGMEKDNPSNLLCPERFIDNTHPDYELYLQLQKEAEDEILKETFTEAEETLLKKKDLSEIRDRLGEYWWHSEYMQDPHAIIGEFWKKVAYQPAMGHITKYDWLCLSIDRATTKKKTSHLTGLVEMVREITGPYLVTNDYSEKYTIDELMDKVDELYEFYMLEYGNILEIKIVLEKQGGGDDFNNLAISQGKRWAHLIELVHSSRDKNERIEDNLKNPINNGGIAFVKLLEHSELVEDEIIPYPNGKYDDALDALSNGHQEMEKEPRGKKDYKEAARIMRERSKTKSNQNLEDLYKQRHQRRRSMF